MRSEFGSIERLDRNRYKIRWSEYEGGKRRQRSKNIRGTRRDAERALARVALDKGRRVSNDSLTISEYWPEYLATIERLSLQTRRGYERAYFRYVEPLFGSCVMEKLTSREVRRRLLSLDAPGAQKNAYKLLRQMYNAAIADDLVENMPIKKHMRLNEPRRRVTPTFTIEEAARFVDAVAGLDIEPLALLQLFGGLRREEACGLKWSDLAFEDVQTLGGVSCRAYVSIERTAQLIDGSVVLGEPKTERSARVVVIAGAVSERLRELSGVGWVNGGESLANPETYAARLSTVCKHECLPHMTPTGLRATFSTLHQQLGTPDSLVSMMLGHSQLSTRYRHYLSANKDAMIRAASSFDNALKFG